MTPSPCSVPRWLRWWFPWEPEAAWPCCKAHDEAYERGGTREDRSRVDVAFYKCLAPTMGTDAFWYYLGVRLFGAPFWRIPRFSWAWGAVRPFRYSR